MFINAFKVVCGLLPRFEGTAQFLLTIDTTSLLCYCLLTMPTFAAITSKRQLTIPVSVFKKQGFRSNTKVTIEELKGGLLIKPASSLLDDLAGSVKVPKSKQGISAEKAIKEAKKLHFRKK